MNLQVKLDNLELEYEFYEGEALKAVAHGSVGGYTSALHMMESVDREIGRLKRRLYDVPLAIGTDSLMDLACEDDHG